VIRDQFILDLSAELIIDNFAGGGGASCGIELALGRHVDIAINHDPEAVAMHEINHPQTRHYCESVWDVDPRQVAQGFPPTYVIAPTIAGRTLPKRAQVRMCGNSVSPPLAAALARANVPEMMTFTHRELRRMEAA
jgi:site-specific DNA-cytosine methylase